MSKFLPETRNVIAYSPLPAGARLPWAQIRKASGTSSHRDPNSREERSSFPDSK
jgi:hypothetical protein